MLYDASGNPVKDAMMPEEVQKKIEETKAAAQTEAETLKAQMEESKTKLQEYEKQLEDAKAKGEDEEEIKKNIANEEKLKKFMEGKEKEITAKVSSIMSASRRAEIIKKASAGDAELEKKIQINFARLAGKEETDEDITNKVLEAYKLSVDTYNPSVIGKVTSSKPQGTYGGTPTVSEDLRAAARAFGLTDEDLKKHHKT